MEGAATVVFFLSILMPGREPIHFQHPAENLAACLFEVHEFMARPSRIVLGGGEVQAGCARAVPKSVEH